MIYFSIENARIHLFMAFFLAKDGALIFSIIGSVGQATKACMKFSFASGRLHFRDSGRRASPGGCRPRPGVRWRVAGGRRRGCQVGHRESVLGMEGPTYIIIISLPVSTIPIILFQSGHFFS